MFYDVHYTKRNSTQKRITSSYLFSTKKDGTCFYESIARIVLNDTRTKVHDDLRAKTEEIRLIGKGGLVSQWKSFVLGKLILEHENSALKQAFNVLHEPYLTIDQGNSIDLFAHEMARLYQKRSPSPTHERIFHAFEQFQNNTKRYADETEIRNILRHVSDTFIIIILIVRRNISRFRLHNRQSNDTFDCFSSEELKETAEALCANPKTARKRVGILVRSQNHLQKGVPDELRGDVHYQPVVFGSKEFPDELSKPLCRLCDDDLLIDITTAYLRQCAKGMDKKSVQPVVHVNQKRPIPEIIDLSDDVDDEEPQLSKPRLKTTAKTLPIEFVYVDESDSESDRTPSSSENNTRSIVDLF